MDENYKKSIYIVLSILIIILHTKNFNILGNKFYENIKEITNPDDILVLVNKNNKLNKNFIPKDLQLLDINYSYENKMLRDLAKNSFEKLCTDAKSVGYKIIGVSAYRDYDYQNKLYNEYVKQKVKEYADRASARPGHSEHQTGLAIDVMGSNNDSDEFEYAIEFEWMRDNAHKYGFIMRYPKNKEHITGFKYEPWHYRYVGKEVAKYIYDNDLALEEYLNIK
ncbi:MAG TPA: M15 family metallopeptidase [Tenericutes bacterium]|nr:M15 family metallopeptidase [Mycoplasmatota bacterium]